MSAVGDEERVARAICVAAGHDPDQACDIHVPGDPDAGTAWAGYRPAARAAIAEIAGWRPIEVRPPSGWLLLWVRPGRLDMIEPAGPCIGMWHEQYGWLDERGEGMLEIVTHWLPLPAAPQREDEAR